MIAETKMRFQRITRFRLTHHHDAEATNANKWMGQRMASLRRETFWLDTNKVISQRKLAEAMGINFNTIYRIENGIQSVDVLELVFWLKCLNFFRAKSGQNEITLLDVLPPLEIVPIAELPELSQSKEYPTKP